MILLIHGGAHAPDNERHKTNTIATFATTGGERENRRYRECEDVRYSRESKCGIQICKNTNEEVEEDKRNQSLLGRPAPGLEKDRNNVKSSKERAGDAKEKGKTGYEPNQPIYTTSFREASQKSSTAVVKFGGGKGESRAGFPKDTEQLGVGRFITWRTDKYNSWDAIATLPGRLAPEQASIRQS